MAPPPLILYTLSLHDALPISRDAGVGGPGGWPLSQDFQHWQPAVNFSTSAALRSEEHTSELQSLRHLVCRLLLEKKNIHSTVDHSGNSGVKTGVTRPTAHITL